MTDRSQSHPVTGCDLRGEIADAIREYCHSISPGAVQNSHGTARIYYSGISLDGLTDAIFAAVSRCGPAAQAPLNCDCGFSADVCKTSPCMRKKIATSGLNPDAKYPYCGSLGSAQTAPEPAAWICWYEGNCDATVLKSRMEDWLRLGRKVEPVYASPPPPPSTPRCTCAAIVNPNIPHARSCPLYSPESN